MGFLSGLLRRGDNASADGAYLYRALLGQSRQTGFFGSGKTPDSYEGRIEILTLHLSVVMERLGALGEQGKILSQAVFDAMVEDFDIALREEGLTDSGVKRRIKPMVQLFYTRLKKYDDLFSSHDGMEEDGVFSSGAFAQADSKFLNVLQSYTLQLKRNLLSLDVGEIAKAKIDFPKF